VKKLITPRSSTGKQSKITSNKNDKCSSMNDINQNNFVKLISLEHWQTFFYFSIESAVQINQKSNHIFWLKIYGLD